MSAYALLNLCLFSASSRPEALLVLCLSSADFDLDFDFDLPKNKRGAGEPASPAMQGGIGGRRISPPRSTRTTPTPWGLLAVPTPRQDSTHSVRFVRLLQNLLVAIRQIKGAA